MNASELWRASAHELTVTIRAREVSSREVVEAHLAPPVLAANRALPECHLYGSPGLLKRRTHHGCAPQHSRPRAPKGNSLLFKTVRGSWSFYFTATSRTREVRVILGGMECNITPRQSA